MFKKITLAIGIAACFTMNAQMFTRGSKIPYNKVVKQGEVSLKGEFTNESAAKVTALTINWQIDNGTVHSKTLTGLDIDQNEIFKYSHSELWNATPGSYMLKTWVSDINGLPGTKAEDTHEVKVATNTAQRRPMYELFTSASCGPCYSFNYGYMNNFYNANKDDMTLVKYQMFWPSQDPYYTQEGRDRKDYYGGSWGIPWLYLEDGGNNPNGATLATDLATARANPSFFTITATHQVDPITKVVDIQITTTPYISGTYNINVAVIENHTSQNAQTNGESEFHNVMMKMVPDSNGTILNCTANTPITTNLSIDMTSTNIEEISDLSVAIFIQDNSDKEMMQSTMSIEAALGVEDHVFSDVSIFPNPSLDGKINFSTGDRVVSVEVIDLTGKLVFTKEEVINGESIDLSSLNSGVYMIALESKGKKDVRKIIIK